MGGASNTARFDLYWRKMPYKNKEDKKKNDAKWRHSNYDRMKVVDSTWHKDNRDKHNVTSKKYREHLLCAAGSYTQEEWIELCNSYGNICLCCKQVTKLEPDHIIPVSAGGNSSIENIQPLCHSCNTSKGNRRTTDYRVQYQIFTRKEASGEAVSESRPHLSLS